MAIQNKSIAGSVVSQNGLKLGKSKFEYQWKFSLNSQLKTDSGEYRHYKQFINTD